MSNRFHHFRIASFVLIFALLAVPLALSSQWNGQTASELSRTVLLDGRGPSLEDASAAGLVFRLQAPTFYREIEYMDGQAVERIRAAGTDQLFDEGVPDVPVFRRIVAIPDCDEISISVTVHRESRLQNIDLPVTPTFVTNFANPFDPGRIYKKRSDVYSRDAFFPPQPLTIEHAGNMRGQRLAVLSFSPWQYNPVTRELRVLEDVSIALGFENPRGNLRNYAGPLNHLLDGVLMNGTGGGKMPAPDGPLLTSGAGQVCWATGLTWQAAANSIKSCGADYLIIAAEELNDSSLIDSLAYHRAEYNGFNVAIVKMGQIASSPDTISTPTAIRDLIKDVYDAETAAHMGDGRLGYVLLLGDAYNPAGQVLIPSYYGYIPEGADPSKDLSGASDAYYSFMDDPSTDQFADILIGRLPVDFDSTYWELENVVNKTMDYEPLTTSSWTDTILLVSGNSDKDFSFAGEGLAGFQAYFDSVVSRAPIPGKYYTQMHRLAAADAIGFSDSVASAIAPGRWITGLFDHGHLYELSKAFYAQSYEALQNVGRPTVVFSLASNTGWFDLTYEVTQAWPSGGTCCTGPQYSAPGCYAASTDLDSCDVMIERLVNQADGAVAAFAYSRSQNTENGERAFLSFFRALGEHSGSSLGELLIGTRLLYPDAISNRNLMLFGDPALNILWQEGDEQKVSDLATGSSEILAGPYVSSGTSVGIDAVVRNLWKGAATDVRVHLWNGDPFGSGSTLLDSCTIDTVKAYTDTTVTFTVAGLRGETDFCVIVDPYDTIDEASETNNSGCKAVYAAPYLSGYPIELERTARHEIAVADIHPASGAELLIVDDERLTCYESANGSELWNFDRGTRFPSHSPIIGYFYKDHRPAITIEFYRSLLSDNEGIYTIDGSNGAILDSLVLGEGRNNPPDRQRLAVADIEVDDRSLELLTTVFHDNIVDTLFLVATTPGGTRRFEYPLDVTIGFGPHPHLAAADMNLDGTVEIVALGNWSSDGNELKIMRYDSTGVSLVGQASLGDNVGSVLTLVDVEHDGYMEILCSASSSGIGSYLYLADTTGTLQWSATAPVLTTHYASVGDLDGDDDYEIVVAEKNRVRLLSLKYGSETDARSYTGTPLCEPLLGDIDGDGDDDIVLTYFDQPDPYLYPKYYRVHILVLDESLVPLDSTFVFAPAYQGNSLIGLPALADVDLNGVLDIAFVSGDGYLHVFEVGTAAGKASWPTRYVNTENTRTPLEYISGTYESLSISRRTRMLSDVTIDSLGCLFVGAGANVAIDTSSSNPLTFSVLGKGRMAGTEKAPVVFAPRYASGGWGGFYFGDSPGVDTLAGLWIENAWNGIEHDAPVYIAAAKITGTSGTAVLSNADVIIVGSEISSGTGRGLYAAQAVNATVLGTVIDGLDGVGLTCDGCTLEVDLRSQFTDNGSHGILLDDLGTNLSTIEASIITGNASDGIRCEGSNPTIVGCTIDDNTSGVSAWYYSDPTITYSSIKENTIGVSAAEDSYPFLGRVGSLGHNCLAQNSSYHVSNTSDPLFPTYTVGNHWENRCCPAKFLYGNIICTICDGTEQCTGPSPTAPLASRAPDADLDPGLPMRYGLQAPYPNPFNPTATVRIAIPPPGGPVSICIYNVRGQLVEVLVEGPIGPGYHVFRWNGTDRRGSSVASGVYFLRMVAPGFEATRKMVMLK